MGNRRLLNQQNHVNNMFNVRESLKTGLSFGLTSGVITTLGLMVGLHSGTQSKLVVIGGILTIAVADALSDALGIHVAEEGENKHTNKEIWESTITTFLAKFICALVFIAPILIFELSTAIIISIVWGFLVVGYLSYKLAKTQRTATWKVIGEHLLILTAVIIITHYVGDWVAATFG